MRLSSFVLFVTFTLITGITTPSEATLYDRGAGLIYDDYADITWLQDANYAMTSGYDNTGYMPWDDAMAWVAGLEYYDSVRGKTWDNWRLPTAWNIDGTEPDPCIGYNCTSSEMGHLYYVDLGNSAYGPLQNTGVFYNIGYWQGNWPGAAYWLSEPGPYPRWEFNFVTGYQGPADCHLSWVVHDGDVGVIPEPATIVLLGAGFLGLAGFKKRRIN